MQIDIRLPKIDGKTTEQQVAQMRSYLYQIAEQLNWALSTFDASDGSSAINKFSPQDDATTPDKNDAKTNFSQIKSLIIKSADIVNAYYEEINKKLVSEYEAYSDFGDFLEHATNEITASSTMLSQIYSDIQEIVSNVEQLENANISVNAYINSGLLYYDNDVPVYGLEIGQRTEENGVEIFNKFARFTANKLSFFDHNGIEVAYISDRKLYIMDVEIKGSLREGGFEDIVMQNGEVVTKWVGIGG